MAEFSQRLKVSFVVGNFLSKTQQNTNLSTGHEKKKSIINKRKHTKKIQCKV